MGGDGIVVFVTCKAGDAERIAVRLVEEGLAACVNILPSVRSVFSWGGNIETDSEEMLVIKSLERTWPALSARVKELHPYEIPEIISLRIEAGNQPYLDWLNSAVKQSQ